MSDEAIQVGDMVRYKHGTRPLGIVTKLYPTLAAVKVGLNRWRYPDLHKLTRVGAQPAPEQEQP